MNRNRTLPLLTIALLVLGVVYHIWANWGLVTVHANKQPLSKVIREIEKQGHVTLKTDLNPDTQVTMDVEKVVVTEALETLATVTDARWRLTFVIAGDKSTVNNAVAGVVSGTRPEGWKTAYAPPIQFSDMPDTPLDPRRFVWTVSAPEEPKVQAYIAAAASQTSVMFLYPESWNPDVKSAPKSGPIVKVVPKLADAVKGEVEEMFFLQKGGDRFAGGPLNEDEAPRFDGPPAADGAGRRGGNGGGGGGRSNFNPAAMEERAKAQLAQLPAAQRAKAEAELAERRALFESMKNMSPDDRRAKMEEMASDPGRQEKMEARAAAQDARRSPEQRIERAHKYVERKAQFQNGTGGGGGPTAGGGGGVARP
jgi:hypothetical protein